MMDHSLVANSVSVVCMKIDFSTDWMVWHRRLQIMSLAVTSLISYKSKTDYWAVPKILFTSSIKNFLETRMYHKGEHFVRKHAHFINDEILTEDHLSQGDESALSPSFWYTVGWLCSTGNLETCCCVSPPMLKAATPVGAARTATFWTRRDIIALWIIHIRICLIQLHLSKKGAMALAQTFYEGKLHK